MGFEQTLSRRLTSDPSKVETEQHGVPMDLINRFWEIQYPERLPADNPELASAYSTMAITTLREQLIRHLLQAEKGVPKDVAIKEGRWERYRLTIDNPSGSTDVDIELEPLDDYNDTDGRFSVQVKSNFNYTEPEAAAYWNKTYRFKAAPVFVQRRLEQKAAENDRRQAAAVERRTRIQQAALGIWSAHQHADLPIELPGSDPLARAFLVASEVEQPDQMSVIVRPVFDDSRRLIHAFQLHTMQLGEDGRKMMYDVAEFSV